MDSSPSQSSGIEDVGSGGRVGVWACGRVDSNGEGEGVGVEIVVLFPDPQPVPLSNDAGTGGPGKRCI
jgi:hypothetical protein